jgi:hypothetical protein
MSDTSDSDFVYQCHTAPEKETSMLEWHTFEWLGNPENNPRNPQSFRRFNRLFPGWIRETRYQLTKEGKVNYRRPYYHGPNGEFTAKAADLDFKNEGFKCRTYILPPQRHRKVKIPEGYSPEVVSVWEMPLQRPRPDRKRKLKAKEVEELRRKCGKSPRNMAPVRKSPTPSTLPYQRIKKRPASLAPFPRQYPKTHPNFDFAHPSFIMHSRHVRECALENAKRLVVVKAGILKSLTTVDVSTQTDEPLTVVCEAWSPEDYPTPMLIHPLDAAIAAAPAPEPDSDDSDDTEKTLILGE